MKLMGATTQIIVLAAGFLMANEALGDLAHKQQALDAIEKFADKYCKVVTTEGSSSSVDASGKADAAASGLTRFLISIGFESAARYIDDNYKGPDRKDIKELTSSNLDCRKFIWADLKRLLDDEQPPPPPPPQPKTITVTYKVCEGEYERNCQAHDGYVYCYDPVANWAAKRCEKYSVTQLNGYPGNKCGYTLYEVICTKSQ